MNSLKHKSLLLSSRGSMSLEQALLISGAAMVALTAMVIFFTGFDTYLDRFNETSTQGEP